MHRRPHGAYWVSGGKIVNIDADMDRTINSAKHDGHMEAMQVTYHGCAAFELTDDDGNTILIDPWIEDNPLAEKAVEEFNDVDTIFVTHTANDHLGDAPQIAKQCDAPIICDFVTSMTLYNQDYPDEYLHPYAWGMEAEGDHWRARVLEARHPSQIISDQLIGTAQAYVIEFGGEKIYHLGDTSIFRDIELFGDIHQPSICCIGIGEASPKYSPELFPEEAARVADWLAPHADVIFPMHYAEGFDRPAQFQAHCKERGVGAQTDVNMIEPGSRVEI